MDIRLGISVLWSDESKFIFGKRRVDERMISACLVPNAKHGGGGVLCGGAFLVTVSDLFRIQGTLNQNGYHSILQ